MRAFNHTGPGRPDVFVTLSFAGQLAGTAAACRRRVLDVGGLNERGNFLYTAMRFAIAYSSSGPVTSSEVFDVASGRAVRVGDMVKQLLRPPSERIQVRLN